TETDEKLLHDPKFIAAHLIPDNDDRDNDKVYFFFTEKATEAGDREGAIHTRVGRVCAVSYFLNCLFVDTYFVIQ
ncbi:sema domain, immunoglobulin domain (Ig), short basic domain, secreted, (semaphorin) 3bl isoform X1, partial [Lates japonicus]